MSFSLDNYVDVPTRIKMLLEQYPNASIVADPPCIRDLAGHHFIEVTVTITCNDEHNRMARASAWEPFPGKTPYTKDSEAMNSETSAVGRACGLLGIGLKSSVASLDEVRSRRQASSQEMHPSSQSDTASSDEIAPRRSGKGIVNKFPKACGRCGVMVDTGAGVAVQTDSGWRTFHNEGECGE